IDLAEDINRKFHSGYRPPYKAGTTAITYRTTIKESFVRVHGPPNRSGNWMMKKEAVSGLTPQQIQSKYSLMHTPTHVSQIEIPEGITIRRGIVESNFGGASGAVQYEILDPFKAEWLIGPAEALQ
ncbi:MAG: hypothetical protein HRT44_04110, partial [Bdellovibrionales bacterium]|nr:hypothetical protein [Bdellovibrionales bacterium]NQZ18427.1 hypothetical protein [Bdellovibrionales bacterium]